MSTWRLARLALAGALCAYAGASLPASAAPWRSHLAADAPTDRIIVRWRDTGIAAIQIDGSAPRAARLSESTGVRLRALREIRDRLDVVQLAAPLRGAALRAVLVRLADDPSVQYAEPDERRYALSIPNDTRFNSGTDAYGQWQGQWYLNDPTPAVPAAIGATTAWDFTNPAAPFASGAPYIIAVIDTGVDLTHPDLGTYGVGGGKLLPGYDFICNDQGVNCSGVSPGSTYLVANDTDGWDNNPTDPGDWIDQADLDRADKFFQGCGDGTNHNLPINSTWHGTRVAGIAAAITNNGMGVAGVAPGALLLPVRVIGKCSGYVSDIVAGMYWAAGLANAATTGVPVNATPAHVLNLSLGASAPCSQTEQDAVTAIVQAGHLVVVAAGNDGGPVGAPANCTNALAVAGIRQVGTKVGYSNVSSTAAAITIAAPAGNCVNFNGSHPWTLPCLYSIETTSNDGVTIPGNPFYTYALMAPGYPGNTLNEGTVGTSFAAPIVSGVAALMIQANPNLTAAQLIARLQAAATPFPTPATPPAGGVCHIASLAQDSTGKTYTDIQATECQCTATTCGAGMLNAKAALAHALYPLASIVTSTDTASVGETVTLDGSGSTASNQAVIAAYQWTVDPSVAIENSTSAVAKVIFPALRPITVTLTVTDNFGRQDVASKTINSVALKAGGGGGALAPLGLAILAACAGAAFRRRRSPSAAMLRGWLPRQGHPRTTEES